MRSPFEKLWGHAVVTIPGDEHDNPDLERRDFGLNRVMVLGGDNYDIDTGTGELTNAVWYTQNIGACVFAVTFREGVGVGFHSACLLSCSVPVPLPTHGGQAGVLWSRSPTAHTMARCSQK